MVASSQGTAGLLLGLSNDLAGAVERAGRSVVAVHARQHVPSSGIHWNQGVVVTADHTIEREEITVSLGDGTRLSATIAGRDPSTDIAVLRVEGLSAPVAEIADPGALKVGHIVLAVGRPGERGLSASLGAVSALGGEWRTWSGGQIDQLIRPDLTMYPGFSGGPLVDAQGRVAGLNTSGLSRSMILTLPAGTVTRVAQQLLQSGRIARGFLGLGMQPVRLPESLTSAHGLPASGLIVVAIESNAPGEKAGILVGDIVVQLGETTVAEPADVQRALGPESVGQTVPVKLIRGGEPTTISVTVGERPNRGE